MDVASGAEDHCPSTMPTARRPARSRTRRSCAAPRCRARSWTADTHHPGTACGRPRRPRGRLPAPGTGLGRTAKPQYVVPNLDRCRSIPRDADGDQEPPPPLQDVRVGTHPFLATCPVRPARVDAAVPAGPGSPRRRVAPMGLPRRPRVSGPTAAARWTSVLPDEHALARAAHASRRGGERIGAGCRLAAAGVVRACRRAG